MDTSVKLVSREGIVTKVDARIAEVSELVRDFLSSDCGCGNHGHQRQLTLPTASATAIKHVVHWYRHHYSKERKHRPGRGSRSGQNGVATASAPVSPQRTIQGIPGMHNDPCVGMDVWDYEFLGELDELTLFEVILAADQLKINDLMLLGCRKVARAIKQMTPQDMAELGHAAAEAEKLMAKCTRKHQSSPQRPNHGLIKKTSN